MPTILHWFRRDLRMRDNTGLQLAAQLATPRGAVAGIYCIDTRWWPANREKLGPFQAKFWLESLRELREALEARGIPLIVRSTGDPVGEVLAAARELRAQAITLNKEYEPDQIAMDLRLERDAGRNKIQVHACKDAAILEEQDVLTGAGRSYSVFTPYKRAYLQKLDAQGVEAGGLPGKTGDCPPIERGDMPSIASLGFGDVTLDIEPGERAGAKQLARFLKGGLSRYAQTRDLPALGLSGGGGGTSRLSAHLNAGTVSIRQVMQAVREASLPRGAEGSRRAFIGELIWRDFYRMILFHHPHTVSMAFREDYRRLSWRNDPRLFAAWSEGRTGYPIVDAAMKQLLATGFMHNRLRMIAAMFLTKDLDTHWMMGERFFMRMLVDYDQASNVGGWQWSASTGTDAAPYFRVMNPVLQSERFDPEGTFLRHYLPALKNVPDEHVHAPWRMPIEMQRGSGCLIGRDYPAPIVDHAVAKEAAIAKFRKRRRGE